MNDTECLCEKIETVFLATTQPDKMRTDDEKMENVFAVSKYVTALASYLSWSRVNCWIFSFSSSFL